jgi:hypothetical protein
LPRICDPTHSGGEDFEEIFPGILDWEFGVGVIVGGNRVLMHAFAGEYFVIQFLSVGRGIVKGICSPSMLVRTIYNEREVQFIHAMLFNI